MPGPARRLTATTARDFVERESFTPMGAGRVGLELEFLLYPSGDRRRPPSPDLLAVLGGLPLPGGSRISFEPGGQVELNGPVSPDVGAACTSMADDVDVVRDALAAHDAELVARGIDPLRPPRRVVHGPRYDAMEAFFDADGPAGRSMMCSTASLQVNLDLGPEAQVQARWQLAHAVSPVLAAAFANSPASGACSKRLATWQAIDPSRTTDGRGSWSRYALDARVMLVRVDAEHYVPQTSGFTFAEWVEHGHPLGWPDEDDLAYHLTTLFPPVRPRGWLELRVIDAVPDPWWRVAAAVATALFDDDAAAAEATRATAQTSGLLAEAARCGLAHPALATAAATCFAAALDALPRIGADKVTIDAAAEFVDRYVARGRCPGDDVGAA